MNLLDGYKTYIAAIGLVGLAIYQLTQGDVQAAAQSFLAALAAFGLRNAMQKAFLVCMTVILLPMSAAYAQEVPKSVLSHIRDVSVTIEDESGFVYGSGTVFMKGKEAYCVTAKHVTDAAFARAKKVLVVKDNVAMNASFDHESEDLDLVILGLGRGVFTKGAKAHKGKKPEIDSVLVMCGSLHDLKYSICRGWLIAYDRDIGEPTKRDQADMTIYGGCSGGGVFDAKGNYIGMITHGGGNRVALFVPIRTLAKHLRREM